MAKKKFNEPPAIPEVETPADKAKRITGRTPKDVFGKESKFTLDDMRRVTANRMAVRSMVPENDRFFNPAAEMPDSYSYPRKYVVGKDFAEFTAEDMKAYRPEPPKFQPKVHGKRMKIHVIEDVHLSCNDECGLCWEDSTCPECVAYSKRIIELNKVARNADNEEAERKVAEMKKTAEKLSERLEETRRIMADIAIVLDVDLAKNEEGDNEELMWANDNMRRITLAAKEVTAKTSALAVDRDRFNREADHLAEAHENALESAEYWRERAMIAEKSEVVSALRRVAA